MRDLVELLGFVALLVMVFVGPFFCTYWSLASWDCATYSDQTGRETEFRLASGCFVKSDGVWFTQGEYLATVVASAKK